MKLEVLGGVDSKHFNFNFKKKKLKKYLGDNVFLQNSYTPSLDLCYYLLYRKTISVQWLADPKVSIRTHKYTDRYPVTFKLKIIVFFRSKKSLTPLQSEEYFKVSKFSN